jgi:hypothetical protein
MGDERKHGIRRGGPILISHPYAQPLSISRCHERFKEESALAWVYQPEARPLCFYLYRGPVDRSVEDEGSGNADRHPHLHRWLVGTAGQYDLPLLTLTDSRLGLLRDRLTPHQNDHER